MTAAAVTSCYVWRPTARPALRTEGGSHRLWGVTSRTGMLENVRAEIAVSDREEYLSF